MHHLDIDGKVAFVGTSAFASDVSKAKICFQCAKKLDGNKSKISVEHIIPKWILRNYDLFHDSVTLPNSTKLKYKDYVIPCCESCNGFLSKELETPLSKIISAGYDHLIENVNEDLVDRLYLWLATIFTKTHIKDQLLRMTLDRRVKYSSIAEGMRHDWERFHHVYCLSRALYTNSQYSPYCIGSMFITHVDNAGTTKEFDYFDLSYALTAGILLGDIGIIVVFGDAGAVHDKLSESILSKLSDSITSVQLRELVARFACCNLHIKNLPQFSTYSSSKIQNSQTYIACNFTHPAPLFHEYNPQIFGGLMDRLLGDLMEGKTDVENDREVLRKGELSFIFNNDHEVILPENSFRIEQKAR